MVNNKVIWHEGLLLQPQHFQQQDRHIEYALAKTLVLHDHHSWGFFMLDLDLDCLATGHLGILSCSGLFQDGTLFNIPGDAPAPKPISIPEGLNNALVYLTLPQRLSHQPEMSNDHKEPTRYHNHSLDIMDNTTGTTKTMPVQVAALNLSLSLEITPGALCLPITLIEESRSHFNITMSKNFWAPMLNVQTLTPLKKFLEECHTLLHHRGSMLSDRLTDTQQVGTAETVDFMLLQITNKYQPLLHYLNYKCPLHPETLFQTLIQLLGEIATFTNNKRRAPEPPIYNHLDLLSAFQPIMDELRHALSMVLEQNAGMIALEQQSGGIWAGPILDKTLIDSSDFILAIYADIPAEHLKTQISTQLKVAPVEHIRNLISRALPGIEINPLAIVPRQIPYHANFIYFNLNQNHPLWATLSSSAGIAFHAGTHFPGLKLELWAVRG